MIGIDIVEIEDFAGRDFSRIFTPRELEYINCAPNSARKTEIMAGLYAGKEAVFKAFGLGGLGLEILREIEILHDACGAPTCVFRGVAVQLSISHTRHTAVAIAAANAAGVITVPTGK